MIMRDAIDAGGEIDSGAIKNISEGCGSKEYSAGWRSLDIGPVICERADRCRGKGRGERGGGPEAKTEGAPNEDPTSPILGCLERQGAARTWIAHQIFRRPARIGTSSPTRTLPTSVNNKAWLATKMAVYTVLGFGTPFFGAWFQM